MEATTAAEYYSPAELGLRRVHISLSTGADRIDRERPGVRLLRPDERERTPRKTTIFLISPNLDRRIRQSNGETILNRTNINRERENADNKMGRKERDPLDPQPPSSEEGRSKCDRLRFVVSRVLSSALFPLPTTRRGGGGLGAALLGSRCGVAERRGARCALFIIRCGSTALPGSVAVPLPLGGSVNGVRLTVSPSGAPAAGKTGE
jgi:hypothetical protein